MRQAHRRRVWACWSWVMVTLGVVIGITPEVTDAGVILSSPGGVVQALFDVTPTGTLVYRLLHHGRVVLEESPLGITVDAVPLGRRVTALTAATPVTVQESYPTHGVHATARNHYREVSLSVTRSGKGDTTWRLVVRLYDDGIAYRYVVPGRGPRTVTGEASGWQFPAHSQVWYQTDTGNYEGDYHQQVIGAFDAEIGGPFLVQLPSGGGYALVTEGDLRHYSGMTFDAASGTRLIGAAFLDNHAWGVSGGTPTPWRITIVSTDLNGLINSDLVRNVNPPPDSALFPDGARTAWIRPGRTLWSWWADFASSMDFATQRRYVDAAAILGFEYVLVDAGWEFGFPDGTQDQFARLAQLVGYAHSQGRQVDIWVWKLWDELRHRTARRAFFQAVKRAGAVGIKIDNIASSESESQVDVALYEAILRDAAAVHLMIHFHGCNKDTGRGRTYPHQLTHEGFLGLEYTAGLWSVGLHLTPRYNAILAFVRFAVGPGDYTPVTFDPRKIGSTTLAHQLATAGVFTSPLLHFADDPENFLAHPEVLDVLQALPAHWHETRVLSGSAVGELVLLARRSGPRWFVFGLNGDATAAKTLERVDLTFLGTTRHRAIVLGDATRTSFARQEVSAMDARSALSLTLLPGGGFVGMFTPEVIPDSDEDGVSDLEDCAPHVSQVASWHTYYRDADGDGFGDPQYTVAVCTTVPPPGFVVWGNDPDDSQPRTTPPVVPRGNRLLGLDMEQSAANGAWRRDLARELGVEVTPLELWWSGVESAPYTYKGAQVALLRTVDTLYPAQGLKVSLTISPLSAGVLTVPADLRAGLASGKLRFSDPAVIERFAGVLKMVHRYLPHVTLTSLQIGHDIDRYATSVAPQFWSDFAVFYWHAAVHAKRLWGAHLQVGVTATYLGLVSAPTQAPLQWLNGASDVVSVTYVPHAHDYRAVAPQQVERDLQRLVALYPTHALSFQAVGTPSSTINRSSTTQQRQFIHAFFAAWDRYATRIPLAVFTRLHDLSWTQAIAMAQELPYTASPEMVPFVAGYLQSLGLRTHGEAGVPKAAYDTLRQSTAERGW